MPLPRHALVATTLLFTLLASATATAQFAPIPNSGCSGAAGIDATGAPRVGQSITLTCPNQGRSVIQTLLIGGCDIGGTALPASFACPTVPCTVHVALGRSDSIDTGFQPITIPIPADPNLVGFQLCVQCSGLSVRPSLCFTLSGAATLTVQS